MFCSRTREGLVVFEVEYYPLPLEVAFSSLLQRVIAGTVDNIMESGIDLEDCLDMEMEGVAEM